MRAKKSDGVSPTKSEADYAKKVLEKWGDLEKKYEGMQYIEELHVVLQNILRVPDPYAINTSFFYGNLTKEKLFQTFAEADDTFLKAESALMLARWEGNITCDVLSFYDLIKPHLEHGAVFLGLSGNQFVVAFARAQGIPAEEKGFDITSLL